MNRRTFIAATAAAASLAAAPARSRFGVARDSFRFRPYRDTYDFIEYCGSLGAAGIQAPLTDSSPEYIKKCRSRAEQLGMYIELQGPLPKAGNMEAFAALLKAAKDIGAGCIRTTNPGPRRYETWKTLDEFKAAAADAEVTLTRAKPLIDSMKVPVAIENHRDWLLTEFVERMRRHANESLGCCVDLGNNLALLDSPQDVAEALAPYAITTHVKDVLATEIPEGFTFTEVPLGKGLVDVNKAIATIHAKRPQSRLVIEMITREPTPVPCLTDAYWSTMPGRSGADLGRTLRLIRSKPGTFPKLSTMSKAEQVKIEEDNVKACLSFT